MAEWQSNSRRAAVARDYTAQYSDPIVIRMGDELALGERDTEYGGWIWCTHPDGRSGWVPDSLLVIEGTVGRALRDYSAQELTARAGEVVEIGEAHAGWVWAIDSRGASGWLPVDHLATEPSAARSEPPLGEDAG